MAALCISLHILWYSGWFDRAFVPLAFLAAEIDVSVIFWSHVVVMVFRHPWCTWKLGTIWAQEQKCETEMDPWGWSQQLNHR